MPPIFFFTGIKRKSRKVEGKKSGKITGYRLQQTDSSSWSRENSFLSTERENERGDGFNLSASRLDFLLRIPPPLYPAQTLTPFFNPLDSSRPKDNQLIKSFTLKTTFLFLQCWARSTKTRNTCAIKHCFKRVITDFHVFNFAKI